MINYQQLRAKNAFAFMQEHSKEKELGQKAKKLPVLFQTNGILAGCAYLVAHGKDKEYSALAANILDHLKNKAFSFGLSEDNFHSIFLHWVEGIESSKLRALNDEIIAYCGWLKRAAETYVQD